tara:strand:+ start:4031 stop:4366 length:336 start_codon:yes stop_codon:yes gene_type:complete
MDDLREVLEDLNPDAMYADGLDGAIVGLGGQHPSVPVVIYDYDKCVDIFMRDNNWPYDEAVEWMEFNVVCAYVGSGTPIFMKRKVCFDGAATRIEEEIKNDWDVTPYGEQK